MCFISEKTHDKHGLQTKMTSINVNKLKKQGIIMLNIQLLMDYKAVI